MVKKFLVLLLFVGFVIGKSNPLQANYGMYAGLMYHFGKFVQWPSNKKSGDFVIGVYGENDMEAALRQLAKVKKIGTRTIVIKKMSNVSDGKSCDIVFVGKSKKKEISTISTMAKGNNVLVVTDYPGAIKAGSTINFVKNDGRVAFELNMGIAEKQGLKVSSELQRLAVK